MTALIFLFVFDSILWKGKISHVPLQLPSDCISPDAALNILQTRICLLLFLFLATATACTLIPQLLNPSIGSFQELGQDLVILMRKSLEVFSS